MKTVTFKNDQTIPALGYGTWKLTGDECVQGVDAALSVGYRHLDTADAYHNHAEVAAGIKKNGIAREDFFLTTKVFHDSLQADQVRAKIDTFLTELETDYIDLLLIHWPNRTVPFAETLGAMQEAQQAGKVRSLGVSNFNEHHLADVFETGIEIVNNQVEMHPGFPQRALREFCAEHKVTITAYSPLGRGASLELPLIQELAQKYQKTPGQICINWLLAVGTIAIPKSSTPERIKENFEAQDFTMEQVDVDAIDALADGQRIVNPPISDFDY